MKSLKPGQISGASPIPKLLQIDRRAFNTLVFDSATDLPAEFHYNPNTGDYAWFGGD